MFGGDLAAVHALTREQLAAQDFGLDEINTLIRGQVEFIAAIKVQPGDLPAPGDIAHLSQVTQDDIARLSGLGITDLFSVVERLDSEIAELPDNFPRLDDLRLVRGIAHDLLVDLQRQESSAQNILGELRTHQKTSMNELAKHINTDNPRFDVYGRVTLTVGGIPLLGAGAVNPDDNVFEVDDIPQALIDDMMDMIGIMENLKSDVLTFDVGPSVSMPVTINGIDLVMFQGSDGKTRNIFNVLHEIYQAASRVPAASAEELDRLIRPLQDAQNHLLTKVAELGGRTRRLDLLEARYEQDRLNFERMKSDAEDADVAEVIMQLRMAEAVMQSSMSAGARIIQPTLMDFLR
jgi:flagellin-like hook-associated protein FlgL